jgi:hypothetical protein
VAASARHGRPLGAPADLRDGLRVPEERGEGAADAQVNRRERVGLAYAQGEVVSRPGTETGDRGERFDQRGA